MDVTVLPHDGRFTFGARVLMLKSRHKDGVADQRTILRTSFDTTQFERQLLSLADIMRPNERIYASAGERDVKKAIRLFKERQLIADYDDDTEAFYRNIESRWVSCLMDVKAQETKLWLFDCDNADDLAETASALDEHYTRTLRYQYATKGGFHVVVEPFDKMKLPDRVRALIHDNPIMLWAYSSARSASELPPSGEAVTTK